MSIYLIIPAGGSSNRYSTEKSKLQELINNKSILEHTISAFSKTTSITKIIIAYPEKDGDWFHKIKQNFSNVILIKGGKTRAESVLNAFSQISDTECSHVMIHDAARPNVSQQLIDTIIKTSESEPAIIPGINVTDTLKEVENNKVKNTINREQYVAVQTPQLFSYPLLKKCYESIENITSFTDEGSLVEALNQPVHIIDGEKPNIKITHPIDLSILSILMNDV